MTLKIGLLGGTFNPVHRGHVELGLQVREAYGLDRVLYILSANPPHKEKSKIVSAAERWNMLKLALEPFPGLEPSDIEIRRKGPSWTVDTLAELRKALPEATLVFISGSEGFLQVRTWRRYRSLLENLPFIVVLRNPDDESRVTELARAEGCSPVLYPQAGYSPPVVNIYKYTSDTLDISSTRIRRNIQANESVEEMVDPGVKKILEEESFYAE